MRTAAQQIADAMSRVSDEGIRGAEPVFGLRRLPAGHAVCVGDVLPRSEQWIDDEPTGEMLPGTCAVRIDTDSIDDAIRMVQSYHDGPIVLVAGVYSERGLDPNEVIIADATVVHVVSDGN